jgi:hypothetical protein
MKNTLKKVCNNQKRTYICTQITTIKNKKMRTFKANRSDWREKVMNALNLDYTIVNDMIVVKGSIGEYKTLVDLLVSERIKLGILPY